MYLRKSLAAWGCSDFAETLKGEMAAIEPGALPLQQGLTQSSIALDDDVEFVFLNADEQNGVIRVKLGLFYQGLIAGCNCADDPSPADTQPEYCEVWVSINSSSAEASVTLAR